MTKKKPKGPEPAPEGAKCFFAEDPGANSRVEGPECSTPLTEDDYCSGCKKYICDNHTINSLVMGFGHDPQEHNEYDDEQIDDGDYGEDDE